MKVIRANTMGHAHEHVVRLIMRKHIELTTEDGEVTWEYPDSVYSCYSGDQRTPGEFVLYVR